MKKLVLSFFGQNTFSVLAIVFLLDLSENYMLYYMTYDN